MPREDGRFPRRDFLTLSTLGALGAGASYLAIQNKKFFSEVNTSNSEEPINLREINSYKKRLINPPHPRLMKPVVNAAFAAYDPDPHIAQRVIENMHKLGSNTVRLYIPNEFEFATGNFNFYYLELLKNFLHSFEDHSQDDGVIVNLKDYYNLLYRNIHNGLYKAKPLNDPALYGLTNPQEVSKRQKEVFTKDEYIDNSINRSLIIMRELAPYRHLIRGWEVANEPDRADMVDVLDEWYSKVVPPIRAEDPDTPIISGLKNPNSIDSAALANLGLDHNSAHVYGGIEESAVKEYVKRMGNGEKVAPLLLLEHGVHQKYGGVRMPTLFHDYRSAVGLRELVSKNIYVDRNSQEAFFPVYGFGLWQLDYSSSTNPEADSRDGFGIIPDKYPFLTTAMQELSAAYTFN